MLTEAEYAQVKHALCDRCGHSIVDHYDMNGHCHQDKCRCDNFLTRRQDLDLVRRLKWED